MSLVASTNKVKKKKYSLKIKEEKVSNILLISYYQK